MKLFKTVLVFIFCTSIAGIANADLSLKAKKWKAEYEPAITESIAKYNGYCGYKLKVDVKWDTMKTRDHGYRLKSMVGYVEEAGEELCKEYKAEVAAGFHNYTVEIGAETSIDFDKKSKTIKSVSDGSSAYSESQIVKLLEENL